MGISTYKEKLAKALDDKHFGFVLKGSFSTLITLGLVQGLRFVSGVLIGRYYGAEASGNLTLVITVMTVFAVLTNFGIKDALQKIIPEYREKYNLRSAFAALRSGAQLIGLFWIFWWAVLYFAAPFICDFFKEPALLPFIRWSGLFIVFAVGNDLNYFGLRALLKVNTANLALIIPAVLRIILLIIVTSYFFNFYNPIYLHWATLCILPFLFSVIPVYKNFVRASEGQSELGKPAYTEILSVSFPMLLTYTAFIINNTADIFLLKSFDAPTAEVGIYKTCVNISMLTATVLVALNTTVQPKITQMFYRNELDEVQRITQRSSKLIFWLSVPFFILLTFGAKWIMSIYGPEFVLGYKCLMYLTIGQIFNTACGPVAQMLNATGYHKQFRNISIAGALINIVTNLLLIPKFGIEGAAISSALSMVLWNVIGTLYIKKQFGFFIAYIPLLNLRHK
jgi:O-antigen/teichoic acid export membrane protein